jgi:hypothetical protein
MRTSSRPVPPALQGWRGRCGAWVRRRTLISRATTSRCDAASSTAPARAPRLRWVQRRPGGHGERTNGRAVFTLPERAARIDTPAVSLISLAVAKSPLALGHPATRRARTDNTSPLGAIAAHHTGGRDAASHAPPGSDVVSEPTHHLGTSVIRTSSGDLKGVCDPSLHAPLHGALVVQRCWHVPTHKRPTPGCRPTWDGLASDEVAARLPPVPQHRGQQIRRLAFRQPRPSRQA